ncbi:GNAT family N-acetyltransferase, partial [Streptomyces olivaceus]|uniref:GNAT family N-acetyltransferase n=1 Tax=Streptomyces olivaceus TaxID=47716 RepID=UPI0036BA09BC
AAPDYLISAPPPPPARRARLRAAPPGPGARGPPPARGATDLVLFADLANPTSNGLYRRIGYRPVTDFFLYHFSPAGPPAT